MKLERIFYLDFIRAISMILIVTFHFFREFTNFNISAKYIGNVSEKLGIIGVTIFFILSGYCLIKNNDKEINIKEYFKKRFTSIYPLFWITYLLALIYVLFEYKGLPWNLPTYKILLSILAIDGFAGLYTNTFYLVGEWFLGCIIFIYILFPLLKKLYDKNNKVYILISIIIYLITIMFYKNGIAPIRMNFIVALNSFNIGMYLGKTFDVKKINIKDVIFLLVVSAILYKFNINSDNYVTFISNIIGIIIFIILAYIGNKIKNKKIIETINWLSKYSYVIFLTHHFIIAKVELYFSNTYLNMLSLVILYISIWIIIYFVSKFIYKIKNYLSKLIIVR